ncbi:heme biosynthesis protein HemY [Actinobacillus porcinus]|uniref:heme biosynthesis protein HemY n=1 Tax=Actinobacillus porcinus TaxID=51048 RepID=UPI002A9115D1|nr:heme biosynthesis protein HemY [Actinobacillus porcinus]MDY6216578.1 heme biosynthesis protein HemY [Actinobacillus porcinus]
MFRALFLMLVLLGGLIAGPYLAGKQGYVLIQTQANNYELSIVSLVVLFVVCMAIVYGIEWLVTRFLRLSNNTYSWFSRRKRLKAQKQTFEGLMRMNEGDYSKAEKLIGKNAKHSDEPILNFIKAAEAAQQRGDEFAANKYLMEATELAGSDNLLVELARTRILLQQNKLPAARSSVDSLLELAPKNAEVLKLAVDIYKKSKAFVALDAIIEQVEGLYPDTEYTALVREMEDGLLDEKMNEEGADGLLTWWHEQSRKRRNDNYVRVGLIQRLIDCNDHENAYELTLETFKKVEGNKELSGALYGQITRLQPMDSTKLIKLLEKRANSSLEEAECCINRALGYLHVRHGDFVKASNAFRKVLENKSDMKQYDATMAAYVFEQIGDLVTAKQIRDEMLKSAMAIKEADETVEQASAL